MMPGVNPIDPLITRALKRAIALDEAALIGGTSCRELLKGETPNDIRKEIEELRRLLERIQPRRRGRAG